MTNPPSSQPVSAVRAAVPYVRIATEAGAKPTSNDISLLLRPKTIARFAGGSELDVCRFDYNFGLSGERLQDLAIVEDWNRQVDVRIPTNNAPSGAGVVFWGETATSQMQLSAHRESIQIQAVVSPPLFGDILRGMPLRGTKGETIVSEVDLVFNPIIDGKVVANRAVGINNSDFAYGENQVPYFISPDQTRSTESSNQNKISNQKWELWSALWCVLRLLNPDRTFIDYDDSAIYFKTRDAPPLVNVRIRRGSYLPEILDQLLIPLGYNWFIDPGVTDTDDDPKTPANEAELSASPEIVVYKRGAGRTTYVYFQRAGETLDMRRSNAPEVNVEIDILDLANNVTGHGSFIEKEMTVECFPCWSFDDDLIPPDELDAGVEGNQYHEGKQNVWRRFAANEAGDWNGVRYVQKATDFKGIWEDGYTWRRRRFFPCLTYRMDAEQKETKRRPPYVEYYDPEGGEYGDGAWLEVPSDWSYEILKDELGVRFTGKRIPGELYQIGGQDIRVRVTGVVIGDHRLTSTSNTAGSSPNANDIDLLIDVSDKFHQRERVETGPFKSRFSNQGLIDDPIESENPITRMDADETNDLSALQTFLDNLVDVEQAAKFTAVIRLQTLDYSYQISDLLVGVYGRNLSFNRLVPAAGSRWMQITSVVHDVERQTTTLKVESEGDGQ